MITAAIECSLKFPRWIRGRAAYLLSRRLYTVSLDEYLCVLCRPIQPFRETPRPPRISEYRGCREKVAATAGNAVIFHVYNSYQDFQDGTSFASGEATDGTCDSGAQWNSRRLSFCAFLHPVITLTFNSAPGIKKKKKKRSSELPGVENCSVLKHRRRYNCYYVKRFEIVLMIQRDTRYDYRNCVATFEFNSETDLQIHHTEVGKICTHIHIYT